MRQYSIILKNIRVYAYHGCLPEEEKIGSDYRVDLVVFADISSSVESGNLNETIDYVHLNRIVKEEMAIRSKLLESVAGRILNRIKSDFQQVIQIELEIAKFNPPINGDVESVSVKIIEKIVA